jgi:hypothetical protein
MTLLLFDMPSWLTGFNFLLALFGALCLIGGAIVVLLLRGRTEVSGIQLERAVAAEGLVKTRDAQLTAKDERIAELEEELESITAEHRTLAGISIAKLMDYWSQYEAKEAEMGDLRRQVRILELRKDGDTK